MDVAMSVILIALVALMLASGLGIAYVIGSAAVVAFVLTDNTRYLAILPQQVFSKIDVFALMSMPLFILTGEVMNRTGVTKALINFAMALVGRLPGGLGHVNVATSVFFAGISGSAVADAAALSNTLVPAMREQGYTNSYASALTAASSVIGPIIPPSIILIFYGALMGASVPALFLAGVMPGLLLGGALLLMNAFFAWRGNHPRLPRDQIPRLGPALLRALPALSLPVIILGGIVFGVATPTEAAGIAVMAALMAGLFYGGLRWKELVECLLSTARLTGTIFIILAAVAAFGHLAGLEQVPSAIAGWITARNFGPGEYLLVLNLILLLAGMVLDIPVALALLVPLIVPPALAQGADPVHLGVVVCFNLCIGLITPPMGGCLVVVSAVTKLNYWALARAILPFVAVEVAVLALLVYFPSLTLWLPRLAGLVT